MSQTLDAAANNVMPFGEDIVISGYDTKLIVVGHTFSNPSEEASARNAAGDTVVRAFYDIGTQNQELSLDVLVIGANAGAAATNNATIANGTTITLTSTKYPDVATTWILSNTEITGSNTGFAGWTMRLKKKLG